MCRIQCDRSIAIIPARGGSKGVPRKNIRELCGKPLIAYTIEAALNSGVFDRVIVTTDDEEIAEVSRDYGAYVPFLRPAEFATDSANITAGINYTLDRLYSGWQDVSAVTALYPTSPFRTPKLISALVNMILNGDYSSVHTVRRVTPPLGNYLEKNGQGLKMLAPKDFFDNHLLFRPYGVVSAWRGSSGAGKVYTHILENEIELIDIDFWEDFHLAEAVIKNGLFNFSGEFFDIAGAAS